MHGAGFDDSAVLEIDQVTAYFAYADRTVLGLSIDAEGDVLGLPLRIPIAATTGRR